MSKLYIFGIGGTGSRVIRSLTMLLASGVKLGSDTIVPIIIDPDDTAADLTRTVELMKTYCRIKENLEFTDKTTNRFFKTEIKQTLQNFRLPLNKTRDERFKDYIDQSNMSDENQALVNMLFSEKNLDAQMKVGFKGNPNMGSVVLNQFDESLEFKEIANDFQDGDRIFIISSIFGGTGASGFPLLIKTLRGNSDIPNHGIINKATIGAISVMPYFGVKKSETSEIDSGTFISKTKAALSYYYENISKNNSINTLYYIADKIANNYENCEGGINQKNNAHIVELISALAIVDFSFTENIDNNIIHKEFGLEKDNSVITFKNFGKDTLDLIQKPLTQFMLFCNYFNNVSESQRKCQPWAIDGKCDKSFYSSGFYSMISEFRNGFIDWLYEMENNKRKLSLFEIYNTKDPFNIVKDITPNSKNIFKYPFKNKYSLFDHFLNKYNSSQKTNKIQYFVETFYNATDKLIDNFFNF